MASICDASALTGCQCGRKSVVNYRVILLSRLTHIADALADKEELAIFGERPDFVVYHQLKVVDALADLLHEGEDIIVICDSF